MMPNVTRGSDLAGLVRYLWGPGRSNEHTNPHVVAADEGVGVDDPSCAGPGQLQDLTADLDGPRKLFGTEISDGHVWHCSISLPPEDGELSDSRWADVARRMVDEMGFSAASGKAPCRWVAVHHGKSSKGNDHIHLVVSLVREDGTKANVYRDRPRSQKICGALEREMGLRVVEGRGGLSTPGIKRGEREAAARRGQPEPARLTLARRVRAAAAVAQDEADFVGRLRGAGVLARPRYKSGGRTEVAGYSVALRTDDGASPVWYGGGKLGRDLTLTSLRAQWPDSDPLEAVRVWSSKAAGSVRTPDSVWLRDESAWEMAAQQISAARQELAAVPPGDVARWAQAAREAAGIFAAWSQRLEPDRPGPLARAADTLARSAQLPHRARHRLDTAGRSNDFRGVALVVTFSRQGALSRLGEVLLLQSLRNTMRGIHDMHRARAERDQARLVENSARRDLGRLQQARQQMMDSPGALPAPGRQTGIDPFGYPGSRPPFER